MKVGDRVEFTKGMLRGSVGTVENVLDPLPTSSRIKPVLVQRDTWEDTNANGKCLAHPDELRVIDAIERLSELAP
jgi:hypothetical protein